MMLNNVEILKGAISFPMDKEKKKKNQTKI